jgi:uncharacterized protein YcbK (DUF882 family)
VDRRYLLKALLAGLSLAGASLPLLAATKTDKSAKAVKSTKAGSAGSTKTASSAKTSKTSKGTKTASAAKASSKGGKGASGAGSKYAKVSGKESRYAHSRVRGHIGGRRERYAVSTDGFVPRDVSLAAHSVRSLSFDILNTGEKGHDIPYFVNGQYQADALFEINLLLRDWRMDKVKTIDPELLDTLFMVNRLTGAYRPFEIVSAYRSPLTNASLFAMSDYGYGVARRSLHMDGRAVDIKLGGVSLSYVSKAARHLARGGVGYYPSSGFVHLDSGDVRNWSA